MASSITKGIGLIAAIGIGVAATASFAHAARPKGQLTPAAKAAWDRHDNFEKLGAAMKRLNDEVKKGEPDIAVVRAQTATMARLANGLPTWFPRGSGVAARPASEAKAEIWTDQAGFNAAASAMQVQVSKLNQFALAGDLNAVKGQIRPVGGTCKGCHDKFRQEKK